ncbi:MAG: helix-turn-helix domain-containing protein [Blastocatellia bacterium]
MNSQKELARILETDQSSLQGYETGRHKPTRKSLALIKRILSVTPARASELAEVSTSRGQPNLFFVVSCGSDILVSPSNSGD